MYTLLTVVPLLAQYSDRATSFFDNLDPNKRFVLLVIALGCATGIVCTLITFAATTISSIHRRRVDASMKRDMIERGMSADEIARIIEAAMPPEDGVQRWIASWGSKKP